MQSTVFQIVSANTQISSKKQTGAGNRMDDSLTMEKELDELRDKHRLVDDKIKALMEKPFQDQLRLMRLKREKLQLKDAIWQIEEVLYPDITA